MKSITILIFIFLFPPNLLLAGDKPLSIHVFVALCDNIYQGIVPVPSSLGNGKSPKENLYWGAMYGVKTYFERSKDWELITSLNNPTLNVLERCIFKKRDSNIYLIADAYGGEKIKTTITDFLKSSSDLLLNQYYLKVKT